MMEVISLSLQIYKKSLTYIYKLEVKLTSWKDVITNFRDESIYYVKEENAYL